MAGTSCLCGNGTFQQTGPGRYFACTACGDTCHVRLCVDGDGQVECICGKDRIEADRLEDQAMRRMARRAGLVRL